MSLLHQHPVIIEYKIKVFERKNNNWMKLLITVKQCTHPPLTPTYAKGNFYTLLLHKKFYIIRDIIVIHMICIAEYLFFETFLFFS